MSTHNRSMYICNTAHILLNWYDIRNAYMNKLYAIAVIGG